MSRRTALPDALAALLFGRAAAARRHGLPPLAVLALLDAEDADSGLGRAAAKSLAASAAQAADLPAVLRRHPQLFAAATADWLDAAEAEGLGATALDLLAEDHRRLGVLRRALTSVLRWPLLLSGVLLLLLVVMLTVVVPVLADVFSSFGVELPAPTLAVLALSRGLAAGGWIVPLLLLAAAVAWRTGHLPAAWTERLGLALERLPGLRRYLEQRRGARLAHWLRVLHDRPALWPAALAHVRATAVGATERVALGLLQQRLGAGAGLADGLAQLPGYPRRLAGLLRLGERSGGRAAALTMVAEEAQRDELDALRRFEQGLMLAIYLVLGLAVGGLLVAVYLPIFKLGSVI